MKEKHKNDCNILLMTFINLEKYVYSKKCLKQQRQPPPPPSPTTPKESPGYGCYLQLNMPIQQIK